jgi:hypothetical protein
MTDSSNRSGLGTLSCLECQGEKKTTQSDRCKDCSTVLTGRLNAGAAHLSQIKPQSARVLTPAEAAWFGAMIEGEGSITQQPRYVKLRVTNTDPEVAATLLRVSQAGTVWSKRSQRDSGLVRKPCFDWEVNAYADLRALLHQVIPFLTSKQERARRALERVERRLKEAGSPCPFCVPAESRKLNSTEVRLPDQRGVVVSPWGQGNNKLGPGVVTYSRLPVETCPGATTECISFCYARRVEGLVKETWLTNSRTAYVPSIPDDVSLLRLHVGGDFDSIEYVTNWIARLRERPDVRAWGYTRSWRVPALALALEELRDLPNVVLFASIDKSSELPSAGWRRAWIEGDARGEQSPLGLSAYRTENGTANYTCPEEEGRKPNCAACSYCIVGQKGDVRFLLH